MPKSLVVTRTFWGFPLGTAEGMKRQLFTEGVTYPLLDDDFVSDAERKGLGYTAPEEQPRVDRPEPSQEIATHEP